MKKLSELETELYSRQIVLPDIQYEGQEMIGGGKVCLVGLGGLGSPAALQLAGMGAGLMRLVDRDVVSHSDLHRQHLYDRTTVGLPKVTAAAERLSRLNPGIALEALPDSLGRHNADRIVGGMDVVVDGLDRPEPRYVLNRSCNRLGVPYVFAGAIECYGNASTLIPGRTACLECFMSGLTGDDLPSCGNVGVHPSILGIISSIQVSEAVRILTGSEPRLAGRLFSFDLRSMETHSVRIRPSKGCPVCGEVPLPPPSGGAGGTVEETCARDGRRTLFLEPGGELEVDLGRLEELVREKGMVEVSSSRHGLGFVSEEGLKCTVLTTGIMVVQAAPERRLDLRDRIVSLYRELLVGELGCPEEIVPRS